MTIFIIRRLYQSVVVLLIVSLLVFLAMRLLPGDPIQLLLSQNQQQEISKDQMDQLRHEFGLDRPLFVQYLNWLGSVLHGDLGVSILHRTPVTQEILRRLPITLYLGLAAFIIGILVGIPFGVLCAIKRETAIDKILTVLSNIGITTPVFWLGLILIYIFGLYLEWLPVMGYTSPFDNLWISIKQMIMPVACLALFPIASTARQTRSSMLDVMYQDYIRTARSKGLIEWVVITRHAVKNALIPIVTLSGMGLSMIIGGSVIIETVFNIPGMGRLALNSVFNKDYTYVQGIVLITAITVMLTNLLVDLTYILLDPRIRHAKNKD